MAQITLVELQKSHCFMVNVSLVLVKVTMSSPPNICEHVLQWRRELHLCDPCGALVAPLFNLARTK